MDGSVDGRLVDGRLVDHGLGVSFLAMSVQVAVR
jgi:hypothetical protein